VDSPALVRAEQLVANFYTFEGVVRALNGVSLVVKDGETYGLVGESGCGKSVTVRSMMRIVPAPGRIDGGRILVFLTPENRSAGVDIVQRTEAYMESIRGCDISMIFQEPGAALNPVLTVSDQVEESYRFHRMDTLLAEVIGAVRAERAALPPLAPARGWKALQEALFTRELSALRRRDERVREIDAALAALEETADGPGASPAAAHRAQLNRHRDRTGARSVAVAVARHTPFLRRYRRRLSAAIRGHVVELMRSLGIPNPENVARCYPHELSGGMQQRIVIAIALACHPTLLIADEPTSNLDVTIQAQIVELIRTLKKTTISSVLFITHDLGLVAEVCDRVTVMYAGDVCETADVKALFRGPLHPYTRGLLAAVPGVGGRQELATIPGAVPNLIRPPAGCRFHPRCASAMDICRREKPPLVERGPDHHVACHLYDGPGTARADVEAGAGPAAQGAPHA
jgi:peptide/nickel transport system ATP-binding protein